MKLEIKYQVKNSNPNSNPNLNPNANPNPNPNLNWNLNLNHKLKWADEVQNRPMKTKILSMAKPNCGDDNTTVGQEPK